MNYFITAIHTDSGKTLVSAIVTEMLMADYWKPVQAGFPRDTEAVEALISNKSTVFHPEAYLLHTPASPHAAALIDRVRIDPDRIVPPVSDRDLVIEGAGGAMVPLNDEDVVLDLVPGMEAELILVSNLYLGSINHTLLTAEYIRTRKYRVKGLVFNGPENAESERIILKKTGYKHLLTIRPEAEVNKEMVRKYAERLKENWL